MNVSKLGFRSNLLNNKQDNNKVKTGALVGVGLGSGIGIFEISGLNPDEMAKETKNLLDQPVGYRESYYKSLKETYCIKKRISLSTILDNKQLQKEIKYWNFVKNNPKVAKTGIITAHALVMGAIAAGTTYLITYARSKLSK